MGSATPTPRTAAYRQGPAVPLSAKPRRLPQTDRDRLPQTDRDRLPSANFAGLVFFRISRHAGTRRGRPIYAFVGTISRLRGSATGAIEYSIPLWGRVLKLSD